MVWVSYCTSKDGYRHRLVALARRKRVRFFVSEYILEEIKAVLTEDLDLSDRFALLARRAVLRIAKAVDPRPSKRRFVAGDPNDDPIVLAALTAKVDYLVTADKEILKVKKVEDVDILTPHQWEEKLLSH